MGSIIEKAYTDSLRKTTRLLTSVHAGRIVLSKVGECLIYAHRSNTSQIRWFRQSFCQRKARSFVQLS